MPERCSQRIPCSSDDQGNKTAGKFCVCSPSGECKIEFGENVTNPGSMTATTIYFHSPTCTDAIFCSWSVHRLASLLGTLHRRWRLIASSQDIHIHSSHGRVPSERCQRLAWSRSFRCLFACDGLLSFSARLAPGLSRGCEHRLADHIRGSPLRCCGGLLFHSSPCRSPVVQGWWSHRSLCCVVFGWSGAISSDATD